MNKTYYLFELGDKTESSAGLISTLCDFGGIDNHQWPSYSVKSCRAVRRGFTSVLKGYLPYSRDRKLIALSLILMICAKISSHIVNAEPLVGKFLSFQKALIFFVPLPRIHLAIKRLDIDGTLVGMNIEDAWCATFLMSFKQRLYISLQSSLQFLLLQVPGRLVVEPFFNEDLLLASFNGGIGSGQYFRAIGHLGKFVKLGEQRQWIQLDCSVVWRPEKWQSLARKKIDSY